MRYIHFNFLDKFKGLDAPPALKTSPAHMPETIKDVSADVPINPKMMFELPPYDRTERFSHVVESTPSENTLFNNEQSMDLANAQSAGLTIIFQDNNMNKAHDKAHRKALKLYQKISKTQNPTISFKKSIKNVNRGKFSGLPDKPNERMQLEKCH